MTKTIRNTDEAQTLALQALSFLLENDDRLMEFLGLSGLGLDNLRELAADPSFQAGILDYYLQNEAVLLEFSAHIGANPLSVARARHFLPGATFDA